MVHSGLVSLSHFCSGGTSPAQFRRSCLGMTESPENTNPTRQRGPVGELAGGPDKCRGRAATRGTRAVYDNASTARLLLRLRYHDNKLSWPPGRLLLEPRRRRHVTSLGRPPEDCEVVSIHEPRERRHVRIPRVVECNLAPPGLSVLWTLLFPGLMPRANCMSPLPRLRKRLVRETSRSCLGMTESPENTNPTRQRGPVGRIPCPSVRSPDLASLETNFQHAPTDWSCHGMTYWTTDYELCHPDLTSKMPNAKPWYNARQGDRYHLR
jgi:hypothetical protein